MTKEDFARLLEPPSTTRMVDRALRVADQVRGLKNWYPVVRMRKDSMSVQGALVKLEFRAGWEMYVRDGTHDIFAVWEVLFAGGYRSAERLIRKPAGQCCVLDLGGHIGSFSLRAARARPDVFVETYEPGPDNRKALVKNLDLNPELAKRIHVYDEAVAGCEGEASYHLDLVNPGASSLYGKAHSAKENGVAVKTISLSEALSRCMHPTALVKLDVEGAEYEILDATSKADWARIPAILAEVHADPAGKSTGEEWLRRMYDLGFTRQKKEFSTILLERE